MNPSNNKTQSNNRTRINHQIRVPEVFLLGSDGSKIGVTKTNEALALAKAEGLDLVEISSKDTMPVCRIMEYGKYKYDQQKKAKAIRQKITELKEVQVRPVTNQNDLMIRANQIKAWFEEGHKVQIICKFRGRELEHKSLGKEIINELLDLVGPHKIDQVMTETDRQVLVTIAKEVQVPTKPSKKSQLEPTSK